MYSVVFHKLQRKDATPWFACNNPYWGLVPINVKKLKCRNSLVSRSSIGFRSQNLWVGLNKKVRVISGIKAGSRHVIVTNLGILISTSSIGFRSRNLRAGLNKKFWDPPMFKSWVSLILL